MKRNKSLTWIAGGLLLLTTVASVYQERQIAIQRAELGGLLRQQPALEKEAREAACDRDDTARQLDVLSRENARLRSCQTLTELLKLRSVVGRLRSELAAGGAGMSPALYSLAAQDEAVRTSLRNSVRRWIQQNSGTFLAGLKLPPEQSRSALEIYAEMEFKRTEALSRVSPGTLTHKELEAIEDNATTDAYEQLEALLGEGAVAQLKKSRQELPARAIVQALDEELGSLGLSEAQGSRLFEVVKGEPAELTQGVIPGWDSTFWGTSQDIQDQVSRIEASNQRVLQQAAGFLDQDQISILGSVMTNTLNARLAYAAAYIHRP